MSRAHLEFLDPAPSDSWLPADFFLRQEPDEEEDEEDYGSGKEKSERDLNPITSRLSTTP
jgi:hypothetical protein